jgi:hypothetical protein
MIVCPKCNGEKMVRKTDVMRARTVTVQCPECRGTGRKDGVIPDGVYVKPEPGVLHYFIKYVGGRKAAVVQTVIEKVQPEKGKILNPAPYYVVSIINMSTRNKDRRKGYCGEIVESIKKWNRNSVKFIITSWSDSSEISRGFLEKRGFIHSVNNDILIWRRDGKEKNGPEGVVSGRGSEGEGAGSGAGTACTGGDSPDIQKHTEGDTAELGDHPQVA